MDHRYADWLLGLEQILNKLRARSTFIDLSLTYSSALSLLAGIVRTSASSRTQPRRVDGRRTDRMQSRTDRRWRTALILTGAAAFKGFLPLSAIARRSGCLWAAANDCPRDEHSEGLSGALRLLCPLNLDPFDLEFPAGRDARQTALDDDTALKEVSWPS
jgi:hypothetical protein